VLNDERESRNKGDDQRRLAARTICWMISEGFVSVFRQVSGSICDEFGMGGKIGI